MSWARRTASRITALATALIAGMLGVPAPAQTAAEPGWTALAPALRTTLETGRPTVVIITGSDAASDQLRGALPGVLQTQAVGGVVQLAEMPAEQHAERLRRMQVTSVPSVLVYVRGERGLALAGYRLGIADPYQIVGWLASVKMESQPAAAAVAERPAEAPDDSAVQRTNYPAGQGGPSPQAPPPPPTHVVPQPAPQPVPVQQVYAAPAPVVMAPAPQPVVVAQPSQPIIFAPAPPPTIYSAAPPVMSAPAPAPAPVASAPPLFAAPAPVAAAPQPAVAMAPPPVQYAPVQYAPVAAAPPQQVVAQSPVAAAMATMILTNPSLWEKLLGAIGRHFAEKGNPRVAMAPAPAMAQAPVAYGPAPAAYAPAPAAAYAPAPAYVPAETPGYITVPAPSPQGGGLLQRFHHHKSGR